MRSVLAGLVAAVLVNTTARAQGWIDPHMPCAECGSGVCTVSCRSMGVERTSSAVHVALVNGVLHYEVDETFANHGPALGEADYIFPLPAGAAFEDLRLSINGQMIAGETMS